MNFVVVDKEEDKDEVRRYVSRNSIPLVELREKTAADIAVIRTEIIEDGVAIGISPRDEILDKHTRGEVSKLIYRTLNNMKLQDIDERKALIAPLCVQLVGEYSPTHRLHYHGIIKVKNILVLDKIKKRLSRSIGRTVTNQINDLPGWVNYMFKQYGCPTPGNFYMWDKSECYISILRPIKDN